MTFRATVTLVFSNNNEMTNDVRSADKCRRAIVQTYYRITSVG